MRGLLNWVVSILSGIVIILGLFGNEKLLNSDIRTLTSWDFWREDVIGPMARFALWVNRETWGHYVVLGIVLFFAAYFLLKWHGLNAEHLEELEEESELIWS